MPIDCVQTLRIHVKTASLSSILVRLVHAVVSGNLLLNVLLGLVLGPLLVDEVELSKRGKS